jgi:hypothetical protein
VSSTDLENDTNKKNIKYSFLLKVQVTIAIIALSVTIIVLFQIGSLIEKKTELEEKIRQKEKKLEEIDKLIADKEKIIAVLIPSARKGLGFKSNSLPQDSNLPVKSLNALKAANELAKLSTETDRERRKHITIQYFPKNLDKEVNINIVVPSLQEFGFSVQKKEAIVTWSPTNAIWFGTNVKPDDVKLVAYTLISAGVKIKIINPFRSPKGIKASLIQIGALSIKVGEKDIVEKRPELTVEDIRKTEIFSEFR